MSKDFYDNLEDQELLGNTFNGKCDIGKIHGFASSGEKDDISIPVKNRDEDTPTKYS